MNHAVRLASKLQDFDHPDKIKDILIQGYFAEHLDK